MAEATPKSAPEFLASIERAKRLPYWTVNIHRSDDEDETDATVVFSTWESRLPEQKGKTNLAGYIALEYGEMLVSLNQGFCDDTRSWYWFELEQFHNNQRLFGHLSQKTWFTAQHFRLLSELRLILPQAAELRCDEQPKGPKGPRRQPARN